MPKLPSGWDSVSTILKFLKPSFFIKSGKILIEVPWSELNVIFKFSWFNTLNFTDFVEASINSLSKFLLIFIIFLFLDLKLISSYLVEFIISISFLSIGGTIWPPSLQ